MPLLIPYLLKLSISLAVLYLFYQLVLRRLTFYNWNRWYLFGYSLLSFFMPFIDIAGILSSQGLEQKSVIRLIPPVEAVAPAVLAPTATQGAATLTQWEWLLWVLAAGSVLLLGRLLLQYISYRRLKQNAQLLSHNGIKLYQVSQPIVPFSFGNAIFINQHQYSDEELQKIIRHEFVHVQQRHSIDVLWSELLCMLNWYNPFAWLIRKAMRQNLEFIADHSVLQNGVDKKAYQYLLLNVMGRGQFSMVSPFNFTSLKKRIVMMNKMKSAQVHLVKFLFVLPIMAVLLLSFRSEWSNGNAEKEFWFTGLTLDAKTNEPIKGVTVLDQRSGIKTFSDDRGFFKMAIPATGAKLEVDASFQVPAYTTRAVKMNVLLNGKPNSAVEFVYLASTNQASSSHVHSTSFNGEPDYNTVMKLFESHRKSVVQQEKVDKVVGSSGKPIWVIDGVSYAIGNGSKAWFDEEEVKDSPEFKVWVDGKIMTMDEANATIDRSQVHGVGAVNRLQALKEYGVNYHLLLLNLVKRDGDWTKADTIPKVTRSPKPASDLPEDYKAFFKRNPEVRHFDWTKKSVKVMLKSGKTETYSREDKNSMAAAEKKYGPLPATPPPPPLVKLQQYKASEKQ